MLDISTLLNPISDESPSGEDLSFSPEFDAIKEARRHDDATLEQGDWATELKTADWPEAAKLCTDLLTNRSKDIRIISWLIEAQTHLEGFTGFAQGFQLLAATCEQFWDTLYPLAEDGDQDLRIGNLEGLLTQSNTWLQQIPITSSAKGNFTSIDLIEAGRGNDSDEHPDTAAINAACTATPFDFYQTLLATTQQARDAFSEFERVIDNLLGHDGPSFTATRDVLDKVIDNAKRMAADAGIMSPTAPDTDAGSSSTETDDATNDNAATVTVSGAINTRQDALMQLQKVADYFRRTEPHSPVAYLAERAVRWGNMPLHVWLKTVLKGDNPALGDLQELLGVNAEADNS